MQNCTHAHSSAVTSGSNKQGASPQPSSGDEADINSNLSRQLAPRQILPCQKEAHNGWKTRLRTKPTEACNNTAQQRPPALCTIPTSTFNGWF
ncbi:hypothetical protein CDAR_412061 [Caerostris darwini]|uniref:Uncharacterized protein n=1 Tax=Caerostris darwini TaxID=1538125 RepID=A0AAV4WDU6_9ARAC|nr:hypothetical protein CDAR_412061 [Caerostris darwini]